FYFVNHLFVLLFLTVQVNQNRTAEIYDESPRTDAKSYEAAQKALKTDEEQTFSEREIDVMLPNSIRRENREF
ncbi:hypothetical protein ACT453_03200, partial [Bacillus sp. D-CC]